MTNSGLILSLSLPSLSFFSRLAHLSTPMSVWSNGMRRCDSLFASRPARVRFLSLKGGAEIVGIAPMSLCEVYDPGTFAGMKTKSRVAHLKSCQLERTNPSSLAAIIV